MAHQANGLPARIYDLLTTHERWMTAQHVADWMRDDDPAAVRRALDRQKGVLWDTRPVPNHDYTRSPTPPNEYQAIPDQWHLINEQKQPPSGRKPRVNIPTPNTDEPWHEYAARVLGLDGEQECHTCGGTGQTVVQPKKGDVATAIKGTKGYGQKMLAGWLENPRLEDLDRIAETAETDLNGAARFLSRVRELILAELDA